MDDETAAKPKAEKRDRDSECDEPSEKRQKFYENPNEAYIDAASTLVFDKLSRRLGTFHQFPLEHMSALAYLKSPLRKISIMERWSPLEIALFEASLARYGKEFHSIQEEIRTKSTKEIVEFYYIWKKTSHYKKWKKEFVPADFDAAEESDNEEEDTR